MNPSSNEKCFDKSCREYQSTHLVFDNFFPNIVPFMR